MDTQKNYDIIEENDFLRKVDKVRTRSDEAVQAEKEILNAFLNEANKQPYSEKQLYLFTIYSVIFLWTLLFTFPLAAILSVAFLYPILSNKNVSENWKFVAYAISGLATLFQVAAFF